MSMMSNGRVMPNSRMGTSGIQVDENIKKGDVLWLILPERIAVRNNENNALIPSFRRRRRIAV